MTNVASRELRNNTRDLIVRAAGGEQIIITVDGRPMAELRPVNQRPEWVSRDHFVNRILPNQADPGLGRLIGELSGGETTDDIEDWV